MRKTFVRTWGIAVLGMVAALGSAPAAAFTEPAFVQTRLEGCKEPASTDVLVCLDAEYTTGNLGKKWNELDLVPHRLTTDLGNQATATTTYSVYIAADYQRGAYFGYDVITVPVVNAAKSHASCSVSPVGLQQVGPSLTGGIDSSIYRELSISQSKGTTCVFDWQQRLAITSSQFSGSSLQSYLFDQVNLSGGKKTVPLPLGEVKPQTIAKTMEAAQGSDHAWTIKKSPTLRTLDFGDVCRANAPASLPVSITVQWTKLQAVPGGPITVTTKIYATNPASRRIRVNVSDAIRSGTTVLDTVAGTKVVEANTTNDLVLTHTFLAPAGTTNLNDIATATYVDEITNVPVPLTTTATASAPVQNTGPVTNAMAVISDREWISGAGLTFSVPAPSIPAFVGYTAGTPTSGEVLWTTTDPQTGSGSITFNKTVYLEAKRITSGTLTDVASVAGNNGFAAATNPVEIAITSSARSKLTINKKYEGAPLTTGERLVFAFTVAGGGQTQNAQITLGAGQTQGSTMLADLTADNYVVEEGQTLFYPAGCNDATCALAVALAPDGGPQRNADLTTKNGIATCAATVEYVNKPTPGKLPTAEVQKITDPSTSTGAWAFTLKRPDGSTLATVSNETPNDGIYSLFGVALDEEGTYTVVETTQAGWDLTAVNGVATAVNACTFTVKFPEDYVGGKVYQCTFKNTQRGKVQVVKSLKGSTTFTEQFTFQLRTGASSSADGSALETLKTNDPSAVPPTTNVLNFATMLVPGTTYQMCEATQAGWMTSFNDPTSPLYVPGAFMPPGTTIPNPGVDNSWLCANFQVAPRATKVFTIDNSPPPGGRALTIGYWKNHASCTSSSTNKLATKQTVDSVLYNAGTPIGILKGSKIDSKTVDPGAGPFGIYGQTATSTVDCPYAVALLDKRNFGGQKKASDPLFNMAAQLVAVELNLAAGAYTCGSVANLVTEAEGLLSKYAFTGAGYTGKLSTSNPNDAGRANFLASKLDDYNNNRAGVCP